MIVLESSILSLHRLIKCVSKRFLLHGDSSQHLFDQMYFWKIIEQLFAKVETQLYGVFQNDHESIAYINSV